MFAAASAEEDSVYMRRALHLALGGWGQTAPNPMVGAVVVADGRIVSEGFHARYGAAHAEAHALALAGARARGATMYVTLEPCAHFGKTPPCADTLIAAGVARVVVAVRDPSSVARGGVERLRAAGIQVDMGVEHEAACELNAPFFHAHANDGRPWVTLKLAVSSDGAVADPVGMHRWITGPEARREVHRMRANADAIAVGIGTVLADDPMLTVRDAPAPRVPPVRVVLDSSLRIPPDAALVRTAHEAATLVIARAPSVSVSSEKLGLLTRAGVEVATAPDLSAAMRMLRDRGVRALLVEAGPRLTASLINASLVDRLVMFRARLVFGEQAPRAFAFLPPEFNASLHDRRVVDRRPFGDDEMTSYAFQDVPCSPD